MPYFRSQDCRPCWDKVQSDGSGTSQLGPEGDGREEPEESAEILHLVEVQRGAGKDFPEGISY